MDEFSTSQGAQRREFTKGSDMAAKSKVTNSKTPGFAKGGSTKMFGKQAAAEQKPFSTAKTPGAGGGKFAKGGSTKMFGKQSAEPAKAGGKPK